MVQEVGLAETCASRFASNRNFHILQCSRPPYSSMRKFLHAWSHALHAATMACWGKRGPCSMFRKKRFAELSRIRVLSTHFKQSVLRGMHQLFTSGLSGNQTVTAVRVKASETLSRPGRWIKWILICWILQHANLPREAQGPHDF